MKTFALFHHCRSALWIALLLFLFLAGYPWTLSAQSAQTAPPPNQAPFSPEPDARYKADILVVVAHPDDETEIAAYLARAIYDQHKRVAVLFGTRGDSGGNVMGYEQTAALGAEREIEARRALGSLGVSNVWFIGAPDTPGQNVLASLETWNHGSALEETVRIIRLTRPDVILTWLPDFVVGENHEDHQAAGVIATEAFDLAGDPTKFPEQVSFPRDHSGIGNFTEGLRPWQPKKIYYFSDASNKDFMVGKGPEYSSTEVSPSQHVPYYRLAAVETSFHLTQGDTGQVGKKALETGNFKEFSSPVRFVLGKSLVGGTATSDIFAGIGSSSIPFVPAPGYRPPTSSNLSIELGGPWAFYQKFWKAHSIEHLAQLIPVPEAGVYPGNTLHVPLLLYNNTDQEQIVRLTARLPAGWTEQAEPTNYPVRSHDVYPVEVVLTPSPNAQGKWEEITWQADTQGRVIGTVTLRAYVTPAAMPE
jgi:LmbE family N-acetylglucosaminyl deacetylase